MPNISYSLNRYGLELLSQQDYDHAAEFFREAIQHDPSFADAHTNLGVALFMIGSNGEAIDAFSRAIDLRPDHSETLLNASYAMWKAGDVAKARAYLEHAVVNDSPMIHLALGKLLREAGEDRAALFHLMRGLGQEPNDVAGWAALRELYHHYGCEDVAIRACDEVIRLQPNHPLHPYKKACVLLTYGNPDGWQEHEARYNVSLDTLSVASRSDPKLYATLLNKRWTGEPTNHLLVHREQGFGDNIQFLRYVPLAAARCETLTLFLPPTLRKMARTMLKDHANIVVSDELHSPQEFDHWCLMMSLPYLMGMTSDPLQTPYLTAPKEQYGEIRRLKGLKVGIAWHGNPQHEDDRWRSIPFEKLAKLFTVEANFVSLHFPSEVDKKQYPVIDVYPTPTAYYGHLMIDWSETAALIDALDLVIAADTSVVHMAGALGKPVWLINRHNTDWRWGLQHETTAWYPSMRIFRQPKLGDWDTVIDQVANELLWLGFTPGGSQ